MFKRSLDHYSSHVVLKCASQVSPYNLVQVILAILFLLLLLYSPQVHIEAGLFLLLEGTLGGCTWQPHFPLCWSLFWYLWTNKSLLWLSTGKSTNSRLVHPPKSFLNFFNFRIKFKKRQNMPLSSDGAWHKKSSYPAHKLNLVNKGEHIKCISAPWEIWE